MSSDSKPTARLFVRFALAGFIGFVIIGLLLFWAWMTMFERHLVRDAATTTARQVNAFVGHMLSAEDFAVVHKGADWDTFRSKIKDLVSIPEVVRIKIYSPKGWLIWSDSRDVLESNPKPENNPELLEALAGHVEAHISSLEKEEHGFERANFKTLLELYVPIKMAGLDQPVGIAEIYMNADPLVATLGTAGWLIGVTVVGGLGLLLLVSYLGLGRAVVLIHNQNVELRRALDEIFAANRLKEDLIANLSHQIRNPEAIMSYANLLLTGAFGDLPEKQRPSLGKIRNTAAELLSHFPRILQLARLKTGDVLPTKEAVQLGKLLQNIVNDVDLLCGDGSVKLNLDIPPEEVVIQSDRGLVELVLLNLVTNAVKFTPRGCIDVRLEKDEPANQVKIVIEDTGVGMKPEEIGFIFDEFYRAGNSAARFKSGVGLGLAIVKKAVELLRGQIQVESVYEQGSKFIVTFPFELSKSASAKTASVESLLRAAV